MKEMIAELEEKAAKFESEKLLQEEQFRKQDNERLKKFFYGANRFEDLTDSVTKIRPDSNQLSKQIDDSVNKTVTSTTRLGVA